MLCHDRQVCSYAATQLLKGPFPLHAKDSTYTSGSVEQYSAIGLADKGAE